MNTIHCTNCRRSYPETGVPYRCPACGGLYDYASPFVFQTDKVDPSQPGIWRYRHAFPLPGDAPIVSLGEGNTPLIPADVNGREVYFKLEASNPTGSFKDRGSATLVSALQSRGVQAGLEDSSGNAGASFAAYAARAGMQATVYVPETASGPKRRQIEAYGSEVIQVAGPRSNAAEAVRKAADEGKAYASHAFLPFNLPGYATLAYELVEQLEQLTGHLVPGSVVMPVGQGGLLLGAYRGFQALKQAGVIASLPVLYGVQARACAPLWALASYGADGLRWVTEAPTLAEGVRVRFPLRGDAVLQVVAETGGGWLAVDEEEILPGRDQLSHRGLYVEPTSALVWSALAQIIGRAPEPIVAILTGSGLKYGE